MISQKVAIVVLLSCVSYVLAEAPLGNRYRPAPQRYRQAPSRFLLARQEAPYPASSGGEPAAEYGPPSSPKPVYGAPAPTTTPSPQYGAPPAPVDEPELANPSNTDTEAVPGAPARLRQFERFTLPSKKGPQKFSQRLELQQQVQQFPATLQPPLAAAPHFHAAATLQPPLIAEPHFHAAPHFHEAALPPPAALHAPAPIQPVFASPYQLAALQQPEGSYFIELPNGSIQRVNYLTQPSLVDDSVLAKLEFRPVAEVQTTIAEPQLFVNTLVHSHVSADE